MILLKLHEALAAVGPQREALDDVERQLRSMIARLSGSEEEVRSVPVAAHKEHALAANSERDRLDDIGDLLRTEGKPMHIKTIVARLSDINGKAISRTLIEPGLNRHIAKVKNARIAKFGPSTFGLPEWKARQDDRPLNNVA